MPDWIQTLLECRARRQHAILVSVASVRGSAPREAGARMVVTSDAQFGTIGGGNLEHQAVGIAREMLAGLPADQPSDPGAGALRRFPLGASLGQCCGGSVNLMFDAVPADAGETGWLDAVAQPLSRNERCVIVSVAGRPASAGKIVIADHRITGTLGSVEADAAAVALARESRGESAGPRLVRPDDLSNGLSGDHPAAPLWFVDPIAPPDFTIVLFGAGHVGRALVRIVSEWPCRVIWVDPRADEFPAVFPPNVRAVVSDDPVAEVDSAPAGSYFLVMTHSHPLDEALALRILSRPDVGWFGLIGSATKRLRFEHRLRGQRVDAARLSAMACPIGLPGIPGKEPGVVAVSVAAQLLQLRAARAASPAVTSGAASLTSDPEHRNMSIGS